MTAYTTLVRGVPDLVMLLLVYFGGQRLVNTLAGGARLRRPPTSRPSSPASSRSGFIYGAYLTETFRGAYLTIPKGQLDAGRALGLHPFAVLWTVAIPQLVRFALPGYANVWQVLVKSTALVSVIGLQDVVGLANDAGKSAHQPFVFFAAVLARLSRHHLGLDHALRARSSAATPRAAPMRADLVLANWTLFAEGVLMTLQLTAIALAVGFASRCPPASPAPAGCRRVSPPVNAYVYLFRGTPLLVQTFLIYYGLAQFEWMRESWAWTFLREPWWCAVIAFSLNSGAYMTEIVRGAVETTPKGEIEAARALGLSPRQVDALVLLPSALRRALPQFGNEAVFMLHGSAVASVITLQDILGAGRTLNAKFYLAYEGFVTAAILYMALTFLLVLAFRALERRYLRHLAVMR